MGFGNKSENYHGAVETAYDEEQFVDKILEPSKTLQEAVRRTKFKDATDRLNAENLQSWLTEFNVINGIADMLFDLDARMAEGGYNFALAIQGHAKIPVPSAMGVNLSKEDNRALKEVATMREKQRAKQNDEDNE